MFKNSFNSNRVIAANKPDAVAFIKGGINNRALHGVVTFTQRPNGVIVTSEIFNLPKNESYNSAILAFHIHEGTKCSGNADDEFADAGAHYNPYHYPHPYHAGDLLPLFSNNGYAWSSFLTNRFNVNEIIGRTVIIHSNPDDFTTQPSGNSGSKIACGKIIKL
jgi:Cu-Zn family superoxide dismutase